MDTYATVKGQIVIPAALRRKYGIKAGTLIIVSDNDEEIVFAAGGLNNIFGNYRAP